MNRPRLSRALPALGRNSVAIMFQYRGEIVLWAMWGVVYPAVALAMWSAAIPAGSASGNIRGYSQNDFAGYFLLNMIVGHFSAAWDAFDLGYMVRSGSMSPLLLRPILPIWNSLTGNLAYKVVTLVILIPIWLGFALLVHPHFETNGIDLVLGIPAAILAAAINYIWGYNIALLAFWTPRVDAIAELWFGASLFIGGRLAPISLLPAVLQWMAAFLPFQWISWFPAEALLGRLSTSQLGAGVMWQLGWLGLGLLLFRLIWREALKRYTAVGA
jgi:ABC-2 type transport system permease protein